jgi:hypothetical protein
MLKNLVSATGNTVHAQAPDNGMGFQPLCTPVGTANGASVYAFSRFYTTKATVVTCKKCCKKIAAAAAEITVEQGDKVTRSGLAGRVLEIAVRAGVTMVAVAFGFEMLWVKATELVAL